MGVVETLVPRILRIQIDHWKPDPFDYTPSRQQIESQALDRFQAYDESTIQQATTRFADRYLKIRPLKVGAFLNETAIKTASQHNFDVHFDPSVQDDVCARLFERFERVTSKTVVSRSGLIDAVGVEPERIDQNVYVLWSRGVLDLSVRPSRDVSYGRVHLTEYGRKRYYQRTQGNSPSSDELDIS